MERLEIIEDKSCYLYASHENPRAIIVQILASEELDSINQEVEMIKHGTDIPFALLTYAIDNWAIELTPWPDSNISKDESVGRHANETLLNITQVLIPYLQQQYGSIPILLGGYSLGGLFSRWAASQCKVFAAIAAVSPSLWIRDWDTYSLCHPIWTDNIYLSLGDREEFARNKAMAQVGNRLRQEYCVLARQLGTEHCILEWNPGNHFKETTRRMSKGFIWCLTKTMSK